jgi:hypothetical protein
MGPRRHRRVRCLPCRPDDLRRPAAELQILVLVVVAIMLVVFAIRLLGPILSFLLIILLILLIAHRLVPGMQMPHSLLPGNWQNGSVHI